MKSLLLTALLCSLGMTIIHASESRSGSGKLPIDTQRKREQNTDLKALKHKETAKQRKQERNDARSKKQAHQDNWS